jgi:adenylate kinase family enzyme
MQRIAIVGNTGSGKTTLGERLAECLGYPLIDLDAIHWGPAWTPAPQEEFRGRVAAALDGPTWITAGNYSKARDITWGRADTLIWLDYPLAVSLARLFRRTVGRIVTREELLRIVWGYENVPLTRTVDIAIARLRRKIEPDPHHPRYLRTVHRDGYCLTLEP